MERRGGVRACARRSRRRNDMGSAAVHAVVHAVAIGEERTGGEARRSEGAGRSNDASHCCGIRPCGDSDMQVRGGCTPVQKRGEAGGDVPTILLNDPRPIT